MHLLTNNVKVKDGNFANRLIHIQKLPKFRSSWSEKIYLVFHIFWVWVNIDKLHTSDDDRRNFKDSSRIETVPAINRVHTHTRTHLRTQVIVKTENLKKYFSHENVSLRRSWWITRQGHFGKQLSLQKRRNIDVPFIWTEKDPLMDILTNFRLIWKQS